ncbi:asparaginase [Deferribacterales bacterium RsTz2092]
MNGKVIVFTTGGTIAMRYDESAGGSVPAVSGAELLAAIPPLASVCDVELQEVSNVPSGHLNFTYLKKLGDTITDAFKSSDVLGAVVTHGTDTIEETAYFLDLYVDSEKPICLTAAMRNAAEISPDGPVNILGAVRTASCPDAVGLGALVVMNDQIHAARDVTKTHSGNIATFASPFWGPVGILEPDKVIIKRKNLKHTKIHSEYIEEDVHIIKLHLGITDFFFNCLAEKGAKGLVVEAVGRGNSNPAAFAGIKKAIAAGIPVVVTTRCLGGRVLPIYAYTGGMVQLVDAGVIPAGELNGQKARIKLALALGQTSDVNELKKLFDCD